MLKFLYDLITEPLGLPIDWYWEWLILVIIEEFSYKYAFAKVRNIYRRNVIRGSFLGSLFHWIIRTICFSTIWAIVYIIILIGKFICQYYKIIIISLLCIVVICCIIYSIIKLLRKWKNYDIQTEMIKKTLEVKGE